MLVPLRSQIREKIAHDLQVLLDEISTPWGITCQNVGIKDITALDSMNLGVLGGLASLGKLQHPDTQTGFTG